MDRAAGRDEPRGRGPRTVADALLSDALLDERAFARLPPAPEAPDYAAYVRLHRRRAAERFFEAHRAEPWLAERYGAFSKREDASAADGRLARAAAFRAALADSPEDFASLELVDGADLTVADPAASSVQLQPDEALRVLPAAMAPPARLAASLRWSRPGARTVVALSNIPPEVDGAQLRSLLAEALGGMSFEVEEALPDAARGFVRLAWVSLPSDADGDAAARAIEERSSALAGGTLRIYAALQRTHTLAVRVVAPSALASPEDERLLVQDAVAALDARFLAASGVSSWLFDEVAGLPAERQTDIATAYLRRVHGLCVLTATNGSGPEDIRRAAQCDAAVRPAGTSAPGAAWAVRHAAVRDLVSRLTTTWADGASEDALLEARHVAAVDEGRFRCVHCGKMFRGADFVVKHLRLKHADDVVPGVVADALALTRFLASPPVIAVLPAAGPERRAQAEAHEHAQPGRGRAERPARRWSRSRSREPRGPRDRRHPVDGRQLRSYVDWDAPAAGDVPLEYD